jgi:hypothetical protein
VARETPPEGIMPVLLEIQSAVDRAQKAFSVQDPSAVVPALALGLESTRKAISLAGNTPDALFMLRIKEKQFMDAINTALGIYLRAVGGMTPPSGDDSPWSRPTVMGPVVPGQEFYVEVTLANRGNLSIQPKEITLKGDPGWQIRGEGMDQGSLANGDIVRQTFTVRVPEEPAFSKRYFERDSIQDPIYSLESPEHYPLPYRKPHLIVSAHYLVNGEEVVDEERVWTREANLPYGLEWRELKVLPALGVNVDTDMLVVPVKGRDRRAVINVELINNDAAGTSGNLTLEVPDQWQVEPAKHDFNLSQAGERSNFAFSVSIPSLAIQDYTIKAVARAAGKEYSQGYRVIRHRDYDTNFLFGEAVTTVRGIDLEVAPNMNVAYVMGVGDLVPEGIRQLGSRVELLEREDLATGGLGQYNTVVIGTRAYAVREDLITYNQRLIDYAENGGNLLVLYQTPEFDPNRWAPYPAELPRRAEEVSEEDAVVTILSPDHRLFREPNRITEADFDNWVEQRGSKFFSQWDEAYKPLLESHDQGQAPQEGGCLTAEYGKGHYTYCAYAFHRQLPYGVSGAYRFFANLLSLGN